MSLPCLPSASSPHDTYPASVFSWSSSISPSASSTSYPTKRTPLDPRELSRSPPPPAASVKAEEVRAFSRWSSICSSNPALSTMRPSLRAMSSVRSTGKPKVSYSVNAASPGMAVFPWLFTRAMISSSSMSPRSRVLRNRSSSFAMTLSMKSFLRFRSGYTSAMWVMTSMATRWRNGLSIPSSLPCLAALRRILLRT